MLKIFICSLLFFILGGVAIANDSGMAHTQYKNLSVEGSHAQLSKKARISYLSDSKKNFQKWESALQNEEKKKIYIQEFNKGIGLLREKKSKKAIKLILNSAEHGYAEAQCFMGIMFTNSFNNTKNKSMASAAYLFFSNSLLGYIKSGFDISNNQSEKKKYLSCRSYRDSIGMELSISQRKSLELSATKASLYVIGRYAK